MPALSCAVCRFACSLSVVTVAEQWHRIGRWCERNAPLTAGAFRPPAGRAEIDAAEASTGIGWPNELKELYLVQNGAPSHRGSQYLGGVIPYRRMLSLKESVELREQMIDIWRSISYQGFARTMAQCEEDPAGTASGMFLASFVPFASLDDCHTVVDTRSGPRHGCVTTYEHEEADNRGPSWESIEVMLDGLATSLETTEPFDGWTPRAVGGILEWSFDPAQASPWLHG